TASRPQILSVQPGIMQSIMGSWMLKQTSAREHFGQLGRANTFPYHRKSLPTGLYQLIVYIGELQRLHFIGKPAVTYTLVLSEQCVWTMSKFKILRRIYSLC